MLANGRLPEAPECYLSPLPLPNPLPEGRGDRWAGLGVLESAGNTEGYRLKPFLVSARASPLSLQGEGWGEGALKPGTYATGNSVREQARSYEEPPHA